MADNVDLTKRLPRGAIPSPRHELAAAMPHIPDPTIAVPPSFLMWPAQMSSWNNYVYGDCVTAEEAFAKATATPQTFIPLDTVVAWATAHGVLNGATLTGVLTAMQTDGFPFNNAKYDDGPFNSVNWTNAATLQSAIYSHGPVKIGVGAGDFQSNSHGLVTPGTSGWAMYNYPKNEPEDHCTSLCGYGTLAELISLFQQHGVTVNVPAGMPTGLCYAMFTWNSIGIIDQQSMLNMTYEAWIRNPVTVTKSVVSINNTLSFIKTSNTPNGHVEVHLASGTSGYMTRILETATTFANENDGVWQLVPNQDLVFIKTSNTPNGHVEVHIASRASNYQTRILETATTFANESDGVWQLLPNEDLAFIKTSNTPNGHVEVHIASRASNYQTRILETATTFANENDGVWQLMPNQDLVFIKTSNTPNGHVEVHIASRASNYQTRILETATTFANESDGVWLLLPNEDLAFIKTSNTPNGHVEVHIASRASNYQTRILETATTFANESDGVWGILVP